MNNTNIQDIVIIGGGPAGCAAAVYAARKKMQSVIISQEWGGQSVVSVDVQNWIGTPHISGEDIATNLKKHIREYAGEVLKIIDDDVVARLSKNRYFEVQTQKGEQFTARTVLVCSGSSRRQLQVPGADRLNHKGISYCASCDAPLFSGVEAVVVGGGNAGFESALQLLEYATKVTLFEKNAEFLADKTTIEKAMTHKAFSALTEVDVKEITGENSVDGVVYADKDNQEHTIPAGGVFVEIGSIPNSAFAKDILDLNDRNEIIVDPANQRASVEGVWAAGDVANGLFKQNNISMGDAVKALEDMYIYIQKLSV